VMAAILKQPTEKSCMFSKLSCSDCL
jgi:hypothetical protein